ncbi:MAG: ClpXP protease specificity-enhancing factor SspB [Alphaproteobacteria bacterium]|nr:ClpXP protease specificity-enhancing factor SspB [Alphaproteobacteria bacterium]
MTEDLLQYDRLVERALKNVVREALNYVAEHGLPGSHHLYITFRTDHPDVVLPDELREKYPIEMTIVLQYQFWELIVAEDIFNVTLSFNDRPQQLTIPFAAVNAFADPSVNFALQFQPGDTAAQNDDTVEQDSANGASDAPTEANAGEAKDNDNVVALDTFRNK